MHKTKGIGLKVYLGTQYRSFFKLQGMVKAIIGSLYPGFSFIGALGIRQAVTIDMLVGQDYKTHDIIIRLALADMDFTGIIQGIPCCGYQGTGKETKNEYKKP